MNRTTAAILTIIAVIALALLPWIAHAAPGDLILQTQGTNGATLQLLTPSSDNVLAWDGEGGITTVPRATWQPLLTDTLEITGTAGTATLTPDRLTIDGTDTTHAEYASGAFGITLGTTSLIASPDLLSITDGTHTTQLTPNGGTVDGNALLTSVSVLTAGNFGDGTISNARLITDPLNASNLSSGTVPTARLGSGTASSSTYLRGDNTWQTITSGSGTVTSMSIVTANGVSGTVATATTTPAATITLGAITPTSVNGLTVTTSTGTLTIPNGVTLTGPASSGTAAVLGNAQTFTAAQTVTPGSNTTSTLSINNSSGAARWRFGSISGGDTYAAIYGGALTPSSSNYSIATNAAGGGLYLNGTTTVSLLISDGAVLTVASGGVTLAQASTLSLGKTITASGTTGVQTINKMSGRVNFAAAATSLVVTNSTVTANSVILCTIATNDATASNVKAIAGSGTFTIHLGTAPTAETAVNFVIFN